MHAYVQNLGNQNLRLRQCPAQVFFEYTQVSSFFLAITLALGNFLAKHFIGHSYLAITWLFMKFWEAICAF